MSSLSNARWQLSDIPVQLKDADALLHAAVSIVASRLKLNAEDVEKPVIEARSIDSRGRSPRFRITLSFGLTRMPSKRQLATLQPKNHDKIFSIACPRPSAPRVNRDWGGARRNFCSLHLSRSRASTDYPRAWTSG